VSMSPALQYGPSEAAKGTRSQEIVDLRATYPYYGWQNRQ
jgi:hypothetical protein